MREKTQEDREKGKSGEAPAQGILLPGATNAYLMAGFPSLVTSPAAGAKKEETKEAEAGSKTEEKEESKEEKEESKEEEKETAMV